MAETIEEALLIIKKSKIFQLGVSDRLEKIEVNILDEVVALKETGERVALSKEAHNFPQFSLMKQFLKHHYIKVNHSENSYTLQAEMRGLAGGGNGCSSSTTSMQTAANKGDVIALSSLIDSGHDVNALTEKVYHDLTPLHLAARGNHFDCVRLLLKAGAKINQKAINGWTPLMLSVYNNAIDSVRLLLINHAETAGTSEIAEARGYTEIKQLINAFLPESTSIDADEASRNKTNTPRSCFS